MFAKYIVVVLCLVYMITITSIPIATTTTTAAATTTTTTTIINTNDVSENDGASRDEVIRNNKKRCGQRLTRSNGFKIVGGKEATPGEIPWQVALKYLNTFVCGGTLIAPHWVLTAAHCFNHLLQLRVFYKVALATINLNATTGENNDEEVEKIIKHPDYNKVNYAHDLALVKLKKGIPSNSTAVPVCLPATGQKFYGLTCLTSGWGSLQENSTRTETDLRVVSVKVQPQSDCIKSIGNRYFKVYHLCAGWQAGHRDTCYGDSGGPLTCPTNDKNSQSQEQYWTLAGIVSSGIGCGRSGKYGLYMNVDYYVDWIKKTLINNNDDYILGR